MKNKYRTHECGLLSEKDIDQEVKVSGFVENIRDHGGVLFIDLRDMSGILQIVSNDDSIFSGITKESTVTITGKIRKRSEDDYNEKISTGTIELLVKELEIISKSKNILPFNIITSHESNEETRLKYRYLDLRNTKVKDNIIFRSNVIEYIRKIMREENFLEIQTPLLTSSSPEGARDFVVPSRKFKGKFYALPQAPQQFKQLLMCSGFEKYFQIAPCFRDEDARNDRIYGDFYQLDLEMSFVEEEDVLKLGEKVFYNIFKNYGKNKTIDEVFPRLTYKESMEKYGTDKPDIRNPLELIDLTDVFEETTFRPFRGVTVKGIVVHDIADKSNSWFNELGEYAVSIGMSAGIGYFKVNEDMSFVGPIDKFLTSDERNDLISKAKLVPNDVIFFIADRTNAYKYAGLIRDKLGEKLNLIDDTKYGFCIIKDFPMYEWNEEEEKHIFTHNPFSMPQGGIESLNTKKPEEILAYQYDFVCDGVELASGAIRNHDINIMTKAFDIAGYSEEELKQKFKALYEAFQYGAPPHGGMAVGIDRMLMLLLEEKSIRETVAFPLMAAGSDAMMDAPSEISETQLREVHIKIRD